MTKLPDRYNAQETEKKQQKLWAEKQIYKWQNDLPKDQTFVIDTPPPTVSGLLHMGHIFSYTQADFIARYKRMRGFDVFYPMGFDDNGLPTERLVEKTIGKKAGAYEAENGRGSFIKECQKIVDGAEVEFENLFNTIALSVDWEQKYQTISPESQKISQASFIDLFNKNLVERRFAPVLWDCVDRTALSQADLVDREMPSAMHNIVFTICHPERSEGSHELVHGASNEVLRYAQDDNPITIATTRPELLPACVAVMVHPEDERYRHLFKNIDDFGKEGFTGSYAITALFGVKVRIIADDLVQMDKGTGAVMCCTFGDETDIKWWQKYEKTCGLPIPCIITKNGTMSRCIVGHDLRPSDKDLIFTGNIPGDTRIGTWCNHHDLNEFVETYKNLVDGKKIKEARDEIVKNLSEKNLLIKSTPITHSVKCAERSGAPIEILVGNQWFVKILDKKEALKAKANECNWYPDYMKIRVEQWIDGLAWDWCISRQRYFGVKFPIWHSKRLGEEGKILVATIAQLEKAASENRAFDPEIDLPIDPTNQNGTDFYAREEVTAEQDIMDTWATSSISPQLSSKGISDEICFDKQRHSKLFPADLRPQAHEIIRTWAFYTIAKAYLHSLPNKNDPSQQSQIATLHQGKVDKSVPWKNLMISGWCLASDKTKMSKSKGNVITPQSLIEEKGADVVRYWASASNLGADIAYSEELFKIGGKLITKLFNASKFASLHFGEQNFSDLKSSPSSVQKDIENKIISEASDLWILSRLKQTILKVEYEFDGVASGSPYLGGSSLRQQTMGVHAFEYAKARQAIEDFFWNDFCDNYLEIVKVRSYGLKAEKYKNIELNEEQKTKIIADQQSGLFALYHCLEALLKLFSPFIPHITEELYQAIFPNRLGSIHQRGSWCKSEEYILDEQALEAGSIMLEVIFNIRKFKSDNNLSMKTPIRQFTINTKIDISEVIFDLQNVCNTIEILLKNGDSQSLVSNIIQI